jgi:asparaginyl-tRNA synthetase
MSYGGRVRIARLYQNYEDLLGKTIRVGGWAKSTRAQANILFVEINDGSCFRGLQVVVDKSAPGFADAAKGLVGASFIFKGTLIKSPAKGQEFELQVNDSEGHNATVAGHCDGTYPIQGRPKPEVSKFMSYVIFPQFRP